MGTENARREITEKGTARLIDDLDLFQSTDRSDVPLGKSPYIVKGLCSITICCTFNATYPVCILIVDNWGDLRSPILTRYLQMIGVLAQG
jgi:hypothetical protein